MKVKAAVARAHDAPLAIEGLDLDEPRHDEILVRLVACGVAGADRDALAGVLPMPLPFVPGTEGAGIVERTGTEVTHVATGDAVIISAAACGHCASCAAGNPRACDDFAAYNLAGRRLDGSAPFVIEERQDQREVKDEIAVNGFFFGQSSFATHVLCRAASAIKLPVGAPLEILAALGGDLLAGAGLVSHGFRLRRGDSLVVTGADALGLAATMIAKARGAATIIVADPDESRRALATELGATVAVHTDDDLSAVVLSMTAGGARFALDTTGHAAARKACLDSLADGGICALVNPPSGSSMDFEDQVAEGETLILSAEGHADPHVLVPELVALQAAGKLPIDRLISFFPFERVNDALDALTGGRVVKPVLRFPLGSFGDLDRAKSEGATSEVPETAPPEDDSGLQDEPVPSETEKEREPAVPD